MADSTRVRVMLADDHAVLRDGVRMILEAQPDLVVVGTADNGLQAVQLATELCPDIAVLDIAMPELTGLEAARQIVQLSPATRIICARRCRLARRAMCSSAPLPPSCSTLSAPSVGATLTSIRG